MASITLTRPKTALVDAARQLSAAGNSLYFNALWGYASDAFYNSQLDEWFGIEDLITATIAGGFTVTGTSDDGSTKPIGDDTSHPRPPHKPGS